jgi:NAD(P)-dependent dehydrogenase (short-subunit alcohol dehydrogenase family)
MRATQTRTGPDPTTLLLGTAAVAGGLALFRFAMGATDYSFRNKVVVITGGARGLGLVLARKLAGEGAKVVLCSRNSEQLGRAKRELEQVGANVMTFRCDVTDQAQVDSMIRQTLDVWNVIDVLINDAGVIQVGPVEAMQLDDYREAMNVHFWGPLYSILAVVPHMKARGEGRIVNISSIGGRISVPHLLPYSASKFALVGLSEGLRAELRKDGILVTTVTPGLMRTGSPRNAFFKSQHRAEHAWFAISDSMPGASISAESAAQQIIAASRAGRSEITVSLPAKLAVTFHGLFPGLTTDLLSLVNRFLPSPGGIGASRRRGHESESTAAPSLLTTLSDRAARRNNEL